MEADKNSIIKALSERTIRELPLDNFQPAAVLIPIIAGAGPRRLILTVRTDEVEHHKNQISFPGGRLDEGETLQETAIRETFEEVGIDPSVVNVLGRLDDMYTISNYRVTPYVAWIDKKFELRANPGETAEILEVPISDLLDPKIHKSSEAVWMDQKFNVHFYYWGSHTIWGATGFILEQFLRLYEEVIN
jgi:8-oxo-dGTP pyrophosphatase MutT (NUDIX family)